jgi:hypothetical protein
MVLADLASVPVAFVGLTIALLEWRARRLRVGLALVVFAGAGCGAVGQEVPTRTDGPAVVGTAPVRDRPSDRSGVPRLVAQIAIIEPTQPDPSFQVRFRMDRRIPSDSEGAFADIRLGGAGSDAPVVAFGRSSRHCYAASIGNDFDAPQLRDVKAGDRVSFTLRIRGHHAIHRSVKLVRHANPSIKAQFGATTTEIPESTTEYEAYRDTPWLWAA